MTGFRGLAGLQCVTTANNSYPPLPSLLPPFTIQDALQPFANGVVKAQEQMHQACPLVGSKWILLWKIHRNVKWSDSLSPTKGKSILPF